MSLALVYKGKGVGPQSFRDAIATLRACLPNDFSVQSIDTDAVIKGDLLRQARLFVLPGGRDVPYDEDLRGVGNSNLRHFVEQGGGFLGICAGAYFGCAEVVFQRGREMEVTGTRELGFFPGTAEGPLFDPTRFCYESEKGAMAVCVRVGADMFPLYYNGGCHFVDAADSMDVIGHYHNAGDPPLAAIVGRRVGAGYVVLSGVHCEYRPESILGKIPVHVHSPLAATNSQRLALVRSLLDRLVGATS